MRVAVLIPVLDEEAALPQVLAGLPPGLRVIVCDNGSRDRSAELAKAAGAEVVSWPRRGYGGAVQAGLRHLADAAPDVVVVVDGDHSVDPADFPALLEPLARGEADLVLGDRTALAEPGSMPPQQVWGNVLATTLIRLQTGHRYRDMGPFRALTWAAVQRLGLRDPNYGWNVEMQLKALHAGLRVVEVPVHNRARIGRSKVSGSLRGATAAGAKILWSCWRYRR